MTINIEETGTGVLPSDLALQKTAETVTRAAAEFAHSPAELSVDILLCDEDQIQELNRQYRGVDQPTYVLSFPNIEFAAPALWPDPVSAYLFDPESGELMLGNIALCKQRILSQAEEYGHTVRREYAFLTVHSLLHLFGYDHMDEDERAVMEAAQREILERVGITRES